MANRKRDLLHGDELRNAINLKFMTSNKEKKEDALQGDVYFKEN